MKAIGRAVIEAVRPQIDSGVFPVKRIVGDEFVVDFDAFTDGHEGIACSLLYRHQGDDDWSEVAAVPLVNDSWRGRFALEKLGEYRYTIDAWVDHFGTWAADLGKRRAAGQDVRVELLVGADLVMGAALRAGSQAPKLRVAADSLRNGNPVAADEPEIGALMRQHAPRLATRFEPELTVWAERERAGFSSWYQLFPRSLFNQIDGVRPGKGVEAQRGTFRTAIEVLPYVAGLGFNVLYLPPIHPIGRTGRKGRDNMPGAVVGDPGSPWAIGAGDGGHTAIAPELGNLEDFEDLVSAARDNGMELALDLAFQCSPDHPWVAQHPTWFLHRPDGSIRHAENPPKKYEDIYPFDFDSVDARGLWEALRDVVRFWIDHGVLMFRVDNPHTKPLQFWHWLIAEIRAEHPEVIFLAEAFTRPKLMYRLAKVGFSQSYTYFTWRNTKAELTEYLTELATSGVREFFRPCFWPNTHDILPPILQEGGRSAHIARATLASTLSANWGMFGPTYELLHNEVLAPGKEEYRSSEKYEHRRWNLKGEQTIAPMIGRLNRIRQEHPALHSDERLLFHGINNDQIIVYSKHTADRKDVILVAVSLDHRAPQSGWTSLNLAKLGVNPGEDFQVRDLLSGAAYTWRGEFNFIGLDPENPVHLLQVMSS